MQNTKKVALELVGIGVDSTSCCGEVSEDVQPKRRATRAMSLQNAEIPIQHKGPSSYRHRLSHISGLYDGILGRWDQNIGISLYITISWAISG